MAFARPYKGVHKSKVKLATLVKSTQRLNFQ